MYFENFSGTVLFISLVRVLLPWSKYVHYKKNKASFGITLPFSQFVDEVSSGKSVNDMYPPEAKLQYLYFHIDGAPSHTVGSGIGLRAASVAG